MVTLPDSNIYNKEFVYMPWGTLIDEVVEIIVEKSPPDGSLLDLMCGPGYLLGKVATRRPDLSLKGVDLNEEFIEHADRSLKHIDFELADVTSFNPSQKYDVVVCTGGIHHLPYEHQESFISRIPNMINTGGFAIFGDPYIDEFSNETERKLSAAQLGYDYLRATIEKQAPEEVIKAAIDILYNDVLGLEYKTSLSRIEPIFKGAFSQVAVTKTWSVCDSNHGDYYFVCRV